MTEEGFPMLLILFRHGIAEDVSRDGRDETRRLTTAGRAQALRAARGLRALIGKPGKLLCSPLVRAEQTAAILGATLGVKPSRMPELGKPKVGRIVRELARRRERVVVAVGHEPMLGQAASRLLSGDRRADFMALDKSGAIALRWERGARRAELAWMADARLLERAGIRA
jgi:phosphohistidine phosphatase